MGDLESKEASYGKEWNDDRGEDEGTVDMGYNGNTRMSGAR